LSSDPDLDATILLFAKGEYRKTYELAIKSEEEHANDQHYLGWQWFDVETHPSKLIRLVTEGVAKVNFRSNRSTHYLLKDRAAVKKALSNVQSGGPTAPTDQAMVFFSDSGVKKPSEPAPPRY